MGGIGAATGSACAGATRGVPDGLPERLSGGVDMPFVVLPG
jgi:hypothetical protein